MLAAYGVYGDHEDGGFGPSTPYYPHPEHAVVVTSQRDGSTTNTLMRGGGVAEGCSWCWCKTADSPTVDSPWYRPALLLLLLVVLLIVFLLVSGILVYYNREYECFCNSLISTNFFKPNLLFGHHEKSCDVEGCGEQYCSLSLFLSPLFPSPSHYLYFLVTKKIGSLI